MILILFRHGLAEENAVSTENGFSDELRPLVEKGIKTTRKVAKSFAKRMLDVEEIVSSPLVRAVQTTEILEKFWPPILCTFDERLKPDAHCEQTWHMLKEKKALKRLMLVGHEPHLSQFASWLITGGELSSVLHLKKSGMVILRINSFERASATLLALVPPKLTF